MHGVMTHGTRTAYQRGCRCAPCRAAQAAYHRRRMRGGSPMVSALPCRVELQRWAHAGVGMLRASQITGLSYKTIQAIRTGRRQRVHPRIASAILSTKPSLANGALVSPQASYATRERLRRLLEEDYDPAQLRAYMTRYTLERLTGGQHDGQRVRVKTWKRVLAVTRHLNGDQDATLGMN